jgi:hypothetical protein
MTAYYMEVPDLEPQTLLYYNEIFKKALMDMYNIYPRGDWIDYNKSSFDKIIDALPKVCERGKTIHYNANDGCVYYGVSYEYLTKLHDGLIQITPNSDKVFIGAL